MAFVSFEHVPHHAPVTPRVRVSTSRPDQRPSLAPHAWRALRWSLAIAILALIAWRTGTSFGSPMLGVMAAGLAYLVGVALASIGRER
jgi:hypothetical protein